VVWFLFFINAINWFDYAHGQASGLSFIGFVTIIVLVTAIVLPHYTGISMENYESLQIVLKLASVCAVASLVYTIVEYKPYGLLRDAGVMIYGFALAYLSLLGGAKIGTIMVALSLPIFDAIWVVCHRIFVLRKNPMKGDYTHLHHRLIALGWSRTELLW
jgi:UDP-GlcNAc:undecaprenyl-phosphate GlcNAc-1-phosphate transferase